VKECFEVLAFLGPAGWIAGYAGLEAGVQGRAAKANRVVGAVDGLLIGY
jgi:hypothetical protein